MKTYYLFLIGAMSLLFASCNKDISQKKAALESELSEDISDARKDAEEDKQDIHADIKEDLATLEGRQKELVLERETQLKELEIETQKEIAELQREATEERKELYFESLDRRTKALQTRLGNFENGMNSAKLPENVKAEWIAKVRGAEARVNKLRELIDVPETRDWKPLRSTLEDAYVNLYATLDKAEKTQSVSE